MTLSDAISDQLNTRLRELADCLGCTLEDNCMSIRQRGQRVRRMCIIAAEDIEALDASLSVAAELERRYV